jgi:hypothetical protein
MFARSLSLFGGVPDDRYTPDEWEALSRNRIYCARIQK